MRLVNLAGVAAASVVLAPVAVADDVFTMPDACQVVARLHFPNCRVDEFVFCEDHSEFTWLHNKYANGQFFSSIAHDDAGNVLGINSIAGGPTLLVVEHDDTLDFAVLLETRTEDIRYSIDGTAFDISIHWDQGFRFQTETEVLRADWIGSMIEGESRLAFDESAYFLRDIPLFVVQAQAPIGVERAISETGLAPIAGCLSS